METSGRALREVFQRFSWFVASFGRFVEVQRGYGVLRNVKGRLNRLYEDFKKILEGPGGRGAMAGGGFPAP